MPYEEVTVNMPVIKVLRGDDNITLILSCSEINNESIIPGQTWRVDAFLAAKEIFHRGPCLKVNRLSIMLIIFVHENEIYTFGEKVATGSWR